MIQRRRGERPQKGNPHRITRNQHVIPAATLRRFADADGRVAVHFRDGRIARLAINNQLFCVDRLWDQGSEVGYMKWIEDDFQVLVSSLEAGRSSLLKQEEHLAVTRFRSLWKWRNYFIDSPMEARQLNGIVGEKFTIDQKETFEIQGSFFVDERGKLNERKLTGFLIRIRVDQEWIGASNGVYSGPQHHS